MAGSFAKVVLFLDTRSRPVRFALLERGEVVARKRSPVRRPDGILPALDRFLARRAAGRRIGRVVVVDGPGQFSFLRAGAVIGNAISRAIGVPLGRVRAPDETSPLPLAAIRRAAPTRRIVPHYGKAPSITLR